jgi:hypothetical protein
MKRGPRIGEELVTEMKEKGDERKGNGKPYNQE